MLKTLLNFMISMETGKGPFECHQCGTKHESEIEAIQCGCAFD
ncbi:hypothetical protein CPM_0340 [Cuniculiplasma divulgatum]|uniref:Zinc finger protein n=1 Tax=Cuniculiplasma divulgatum TaxID=1673428 RepID=A0A1R4A5I4_9ARCH|nr:hypothetical protein CPM_0340 [Cuniculiplasma divulgatum]